MSFPFKGAAIAVLSMAALAALLGLPYTQWFYADATRGFISLAILGVVMRAAMLDHAEALSQQPSGVAEKIGLGRKTATPEEAEPGSTTAAESKPAEQKTRGERRRQLFMWICVVFGLAAAIYNVWSFLRADPECGGNPAEVLLNGPEVNIGQVQGRRGDLDLIRGRVAALCQAEARDAALSTALGVTVSLGLVAGGLVDRRLPSPSAWPKIFWFTYLGFTGTPPASWQMNFWFIAGAFAIGLLLLSIVAARTAVADEKPRLDIPAGKIAAGGAVVVLLAALTVRVVDARTEKACRAMERKSSSPTRSPALRVIRSLPEADRKAVEEVATRYFRELVVNQPALVDPAAAAARIDKVARIGDVGFALFTYKDNNETVRGIGAIVRRSDGWVVGDIQTSFAWDAAPKEGSNAFGFLPHGNEGISALGGYIDPSIGRVESVDGCSAPVDRDVTASGGAALLIVPGEGGLVRGFRAGGLAGALPVSQEASAGPSRPPDAAARRFSDRFVRKLLKNGWSGVSGEVAGDAAEMSVRPLARVVQGKWRSTAPGRKAGNAFRYSITGERGDAQLLVALTDRTAQGWAVASVAFLLPVTTSA